MQEYLLRQALHQAGMRCGGREIDAESFASLVRDWHASEQLVARLARRYDAELLRSLRDMPPPAGDRAAWIDRLQSAVNQRAMHRGQYRVEAAGDGIVVHRHAHGLRHTHSIAQSFFEGPDYGRLASLYERTAAFAMPAEVLRGDKQREVASFEAAFKWLMQEASRGLNIQRYKGLGEMNPSQLWETTLDPERRRLVQVRIDDAVASDQIFTTLMGEHVEPRREFIEQHALQVGNLDV